MPIRAALMYVGEKWQGAAVAEARDNYLFETLRGLLIRRPGSYYKSYPLWADVIPGGLAFAQKQERHRSKPKTFNETMDGILGKLG